MGDPTRLALITEVAYRDPFPVECVQLYADLDTADVYYRVEWRDNFPASLIYGWLYGPFLKDLIRKLDKADIRAAWNMRHYQKSVVSMYGQFLN